MHASFQMAEITRVFRKCPTVMFLQRRVEYFAHQTALTASTHTRHAGHRKQRKTNGEILQIVLARPFHLNIVIPMPSLLRDVEMHQLRTRFTFIHHFSAVSSGFRTDLDNVIRSSNNILVVFYHYDRIPQIPQLLQYVNQPFRVPWMQTDRGLVQHVQGSHQTASQTLRQVDSLTLTSGQGITLPVQGQITQSHVLHKLQTAVDLREQDLCGLPLGLRQFDLPEPLLQLIQRHRT